MGGWQTIQHSASRVSHILGGLAPLLLHFCPTVQSWFLTFFILLTSPIGWAQPHLHLPTLPIGSLGTLVKHKVNSLCNLTSPTRWGRKVWFACLGKCRLRLRISRLPVGNHTWLSSSPNKKVLLGTPWPFWLKAVPCVCICVFCDLC